MKKKNKETRNLKLNKKEEYEIILPDFIKSEVNLLILPFFILSRKDLRNKLEIEYKETIKKGDKELDISWNVSANPKYGYPGPFDRMVYKVVEQIINEILCRDKVVKNPIRLGSLYILCKKMNISNSGQNKKKIRESLKRIVTTTVSSQGAFYIKEKRKRISDTFHLYERVVFKDEELPDGTMADTNYLFLGSWYLQSINSFYVKPIDYRYLQSLESKIASRLYEILGVRFYALKNKRQSYIWFDYQKLCSLLPITHLKQISKAKQQFNLAHKELIKTGFLSKVGWKKNENNWMIFYYPGSRAKKELQRQKQGEFFQPISPQVKLLNKGELESKARDLIYYFQKKHNQIEGYQPNKRELQQAVDIIDQYGEEKAKYIVNYALKKAPETNYKMKYFGAVLNYKEEALKTFEKEKIKKEKQREKLKQEREEEKLQEKKDKEWLANPCFTKEMEGFLKFRIKNFELQNNRRPSKKEIEKLTQEIIESKKEKLTKKYKR